MAMSTDPPKPLAAPGVVPRRRADNGQQQAFVFVAFVVAHVVLALVIKAVPALGALHAIATVSIGMFIALRYPPRFVMYVLCYVTGAEVLWRMSRSAVVWELGKYAVVAVLLVGLVRMRGKRNRALALLYMCLLLPSALLTFTAEDLGIARQLLSFNLSGPISLTLCVLFCSNTKLTEDDIRPMFMTMLGPLAGIATLGVRSLATHSNVEFVNASNYIAAGEFGANQVSAALGLGVLLALLVILDRRSSGSLRIPLGLLALVFAVQSAITFSRSGLALAFASLMGAAFYMVRDRRTRVTLIAVALVLFVVGKYVVVPRLDDFTNGKFGERYSEFESDGRTKLASYDWAVFADHPLIGVGPGMANVLRQEMGHFGAAHTEYTRLLAEHGVLGIAAMLVLAVIGWRVMRGCRVLRYRAVVAGLLTWAALFLAVSGMRLVAPSVVLGLACSIAYSFTPPRRAPARTRV